MKSPEALAQEARFAERLEAVDAAMAKVVNLRADFEQRRRTPLLKKPLISKGVVLTKGEAVRWDTVSPRASSLLIEHGTVQMYYPADKLLEVYPAGEGFNDLAGGPLPRLATLKNRFTVSLLAPKDLGASNEDANLLALQLTPKSEELRKHITSVKVLIDTSRPVAIKVVMTDPEGEETEIVFSNVKINSGVSESEVELKLPEGVRVSRPMGEDKSQGNSGKTEPDAAAPKPAVQEGKRP